MKSYGSGRSTQLLVLAPDNANRHFWRELLEYRDLFSILAWRDIAVRYKQTVIGVAWAFIRPFVTMIVLTVVFGRLAKLPSDGDAPYALMVFAGLLPWFLFSSILGDASNSLINSAHLISKVYFPRVIIPFSSAAVSIVDFGVNLIIFFVLALVYGFLPSWHLLLLPAFLVMGVAASLGPALLLSALNVRYRDFRYIVPFVVQFGLYISPVGFSSTIVPEQWRWLYNLNPVVGPIDGVRWCLLRGQSSLEPSGLVVSLAVTIFVFWVGLRYFQNTQRSFADTI